MPEIAPRTLARRGAWLAAPLLVLLPLALSPPASGIDDWPQWRGPRRDGISLEPGLPDRWPEKGPPVLWRRPVGQGFSGVTAVAGHLYTLESEGVSHDGLVEDENAEYLVSLGAVDGELRWRTRLDRAFSDPRGSGSRSSPTVTDSGVYVLTAHGSLVAVDREGRVRWRHDLLAEHDGEIPLWGFAASPLVQKFGQRELVVVGAGGPERGLVAYDAESGELVWSADPGPIGYSSPIAPELAGGRQIVALQGDRVVGVGPAGHLLWSHPWPVVNNINVATPVALPGDRIFISTSYDVGAVVLQIQPSGEGESGTAFTAREVWRSRVMRNHFHTSVFWRGHLYGFDNANLKCVEAATGEERWRHRGLGKGSLILADGPAHRGR